MKAIIWTKYGSPDGLQLQDVEKPVPKANELLIKIKATTVSAGDCEVRSLQMPFWLALPMRLYIGFGRPQRIRILGQELAGEVEAVGADVKRFQPGDQVMAIMGFQLGGYAEYVCMPETQQGMSGQVVHKPSNLSFAEAAAVPLGGLESYHFLQQAKIQPGEKVLINGAGGSIGTMGVQLAKHFGAEVTAVDSGDKLEMLSRIGTDHIIDYTQADFTKNGEQYDVIFDVVGKSPFARSIQSLRENGRYLIANPKPFTSMRGAWYTRGSNKKVFADPANHKLEEFLALKELLAAGYLKPVIGKQYPLAQMVAAHRYVEMGHKQGSLVIEV